jgi:hypothetical protein
MKFLNIIDKLPSSTFAEFFAEPEFKGEKRKLERGEYDRNTLDCGKIKSLKVSEFATVIFYENPDGPGKSKAFSKDAPSLDLDFTPRHIAVESHVKAYKNGAVAAELRKGEYEIAELTKFDRISIPRGFYVVFAGRKNDANAVHWFENEEYALDDRTKGYTTAFLFPLENADARLRFKPGEDLTDEDLLGVAGGACTKNTCGVKTPCGVDAPCIKNLG